MTARRSLSAAALFIALAFGCGLLALRGDGASAASFTVTRTDDPIPDACVPTDCSLREAIIAANESDGADTIELGHDTYTLSIEGVVTRSGGGPVDDATAGDLDVTGDLTLNGAGAGVSIIDAAGVDRAFDIFPPFADPSDVTFSGLTIRHGDAGPDFSSGLGGAVRARGETGSTFTLLDSEITQNGATYGGGLSIEGHAQAVIRRTTISNNAVTQDGGGVFVIDDASVEIDHSLIADNNADAGGGIINTNGVSMLIVRDSTISNNTAGSYGGGFFGGGPPPNTTSIIRTTITGNEAGDGGGGIYQAAQEGSALIIDNSTISGNTAHNNSDQGGGGIMQDYHGPITITNSTITGNESEARGNGVYLQDVGAVTFRNTIIAANGTKNCEKFPGTGVVVSDGHNLASDQSCGLHSMGDRVGPAALGPLIDNGGPTLTHALLEGSEAIDNGDDKNCPETDQRGFLRPALAHCDIGAFEAGASAPTPTPSRTPAGTKRTFGDVTCNGPADSVDALAIQRNQASLPVNQTQPCPGIGDTVEIVGASPHLWGDVDCDDDVDTVDSLKLLRFVAALPVQQEDGCPQLGSQVAVSP